MRLEYDIEKLTRIIKDFSEITKIDVNVLDANEKIITGFQHKDRDFCQIIQKIKNGADLCNCSDNEIKKRCRLSLKPEIHICHAGLADMVVPIVKEKRILGYIILGRIRCEHSFDSVKKCIMWLDEDESFLKESFLKQVFYDRHQIESIASMVTAVTSLIVSENMVMEKKNQLAVEIEKFISDNIGKALCVKLLCEEFHISKNVLYELFRYEFGCTVTEKIVSMRMEKAKSMLIGTSLPITDIVEQCGISNYTYFFRLMKERENITPMQYRERSN